MAYDGRPDSGSCPAAVVNSTERYDSIFVQPRGIKFQYFTPVTSSAVLWLTTELHRFRQWVRTFHSKCHIDENKYAFLVLFPYHFPNTLDFWNHLNPFTAFKVAAGNKNAHPNDIQTVFFTVRTSLSFHMISVSVSTLTIRLSIFPVWTIIRLTFIQFSYFTQSTDGYTHKFLFD